MIGAVFVDTNIWIYLLTKSEDLRHELAKRWLATLQLKPKINGQVVREVGHILRTKTKVGENEIQRVTKQLYRICNIVPDCLQIYIRASQLRDASAFSYWDSLIIAAALDGECSMLCTEDMQHGQVIDGILTIINPFE